MSGQDILIEQLRAEVERLRDDRADLQERCNRLTGERNAALLLMKDEEARAEKAERFIATADSEWKVRAEKAERERDEALAERDALHVALELAEVDVALERSWCRICRTECRGVHRGRREHVHAAECVLNIRAHAAKAVRP